MYDQWCIGGICRIPTSRFFWQRILTSVTMNFYWKYASSHFIHNKTKHIIKSILFIVQQRYSMHFQSVWCLASQTLTSTVHLFCCCCRCTLSCYSLLSNCALAKSIPKHITKTSRLVLLWSRKNTSAKPKPDCTAKAILWISCGMCHTFTKRALDWFNTGKIWNRADELHSPSTTQVRKSFRRHSVVMWTCELNMVSVSWWTG